MGNILFCIHSDIILCIQNSEQRREILNIILENERVNPLILPVNSWNPISKKKDEMIFMPG